MGVESGPRRLCRARIRGVLGYSVCVCVHVLVRACVCVSQFLNGKEKC